MLDQTHYQGYDGWRGRHIEELLAPVSVPVFFVLMGLKVDLRAFSSITVLRFAAHGGGYHRQTDLLALHPPEGLNRIVVGVGMIPRGQMGLIFVGIGATVSVARKPVFSPETFSAMIVMVMLTLLPTSVAEDGVLAGCSRAVVASLTNPGIRAVGADEAVAARRLRAAEELFQ